MQAIILAAGKGSRLNDLTADRPKCMVCVAGGSIIERMLRGIDRLGLSKVIIVDGYCGNILRAYISSLDIKTPVSYIYNPIYDSTNNIYSLWLAKEMLLEDDTLLLESDIVFEENVLYGLYADTRKDLALVAKYKDWMDGTCLVLDDDDSIRKFVLGNCVDKNKLAEYYKTVNIYKFSKEFSRNLYVPELDAYRNEFGDGKYYEAALGALVDRVGSCIKARCLSSEIWYEIDTLQDLHAANKLFTGI